MRNKKAIRASRHESQPIISGTINPQESISVGKNGLTKNVQYNGKVYSLKLNKE